jgi:hypothetical protein
VLEAEKMVGDLCHHEERTSSTFNASTTTNTTVAAAHIFCEFIPEAPFHPPILHPTVMLPTNPVILWCANASIKHNKHQLQSKSPNPWNSYESLNVNLRLVLLTRVSK